MIALKNFKKSYSGMTLVELAAVIVVMGVIGLGITYASQAVLFHYHNDQARQEVRSYANIIVTEIAEELNKAHKVSIDGLNGFSRLKIYDEYTAVVPSLTVTAHGSQGIKFNGVLPFENKLNMPGYSYFFDNGRREVRISEFFIDQENSSNGGSTNFKTSLLKIELVMELETETYENDKVVTEEHYFQRKVFLGNYYLNKNV